MTEGMQELIGNTANILALVSAVFSTIVWFYLKRQERRENMLISINIAVNDHDITVRLPGKIRRKNLTRAEVLGMLGMLPMDNDKNSKSGKPRFKLDYLNDDGFFKVLEQAQVEPLIEEVVIRLSQTEIRQYDEARLSEICKIEGVEALKRVFAEGKS